MLTLEQNQGHASAMKGAQIKSYDFVKKTVLLFHFFDHYFYFLSIRFYN